MKTVDLTEAIEQPVERSYNSRSGWETVRKFRGTEDDIKTMESSLIAEGYSTTIRGGAVWELTAKVAADTESGGGGGGVEEPTETWELAANTVEKDLIQSDLAVVEGLTEAQVLLLRRALNGEPIKRDGDDWTIGGDTWDETETVGHGILLLIMGGTKSRIVYQSVVRLTLTFNDTYNIPQSLTNVGKILSTSYMVSDESVAQDIADQLESSSYVTRPDGLFYYGWLKAYPTISVAAGGKKQLTQEWQWGLWATNLYTILE